MRDFVQQIKDENEDLFCYAVYEWIAHGWGLEMEPTPEQIAAALFMEANTQDWYVKAGDTVASHPIRLRALAYRILDHFHLRADFTCEPEGTNASPLPERRTVTEAMEQ